MKSDTTKPVPVLGIDFGTTTSTACLMADGKFVFITPEGDAKDSLMPSVVYFTGAGDDDHVVGLPATEKLKWTTESINVVQHIKREMSWDAEWDDLPTEEQQRFTFHSRAYRPAEIAGKIIQHLKRAAEKQLAGDAKLRSCFDFHGTINTAVITVPAQFGSKERSSIMLAAKRYAGFHEVHLLEEPVAAALGLGLHQQPGRRIVMIVDLGGGTLDVTLLRVGNNASDGGFLELGRIGDNELGGTDWDRIIAQYVVAMHCGQSDVKERMVAEVRRRALENEETPPPPGSLACAAAIDRLQRRTADISRNYKLHEMCEKAKLKLGDPKLKLSSVKVLIKAGLVVVATDADRDWLGLVDVEVTRDWFNTTAQPLSDWCAKRCEQLLGFISNKQLQKAGRKKVKIADKNEKSGWKEMLPWKHVDQIVLVGGGCRLPAVQAAIEKQSGKKMNTESKELFLAPSPQHVVAMGAAVYAEMRQNNTVLEGIGIPRSPRTFGIINQVPKSELHNGHNSLKQRLGKIVRGLGLGGRGTDEEELCEAFSPIILISQAADEAVTCTYQLVNKEGAEFHAQIIEERFTRHHPNGQLYHLWDLRIDKLPDPNPKFKDEVTITMKYGDDHQLSAKAVCRGETVDAKLEEKTIQERARPFDLNSKRP